MTDIRTEPTGTYANLLALKLAQCTRQTEQLQSLIECDGLNGLTLFHLCKTGFVIIIGTAYLDNGTVTAYLDRYRLA